MRHSAWMANTAYYVGFAAFLWMLYANPSWFWVAFALYIAGGLTISVGYHRLFCHSAFETSRFWHWAFALYGVLFMYSSPIQWVVTHATHHRHSDTDKDPHEGPLRWASLLRKGYRDVPLRTIRAKRMLRQKLHYIVDAFYVPIWAAMVAVMALVSVDFVLYAYLPALGLAHFVAALHQTFSHIGDKPNDYGWLEFVFPSAGEWLHAHHHRHVRDWKFANKWWHLDTGALLIKAIKKA